MRLAQSCFDAMVSPLKYRLIYKNKYANTCNCMPVRVDILSVESIHQSQIEPIFICFYSKDNVTLIVFLSFSTMNALPLHANGCRLFGHFAKLPSKEAVCL